MPERIKVVIVDDDPDFVFLISKMLRYDDRIEVAGTAADKMNAVNLAKKLRPDVVLMDISLSPNKKDGVAAAKDIRVATDAKIILLTSFESTDVILNSSKKAFAAGYIFKSGCKTLAGVICDTAVSLTPMERFIWTLIVNDLSSAEKGVIKSLINNDFILQSTSKTIINQRKIILDKLGLDKKEELIKIFSEKGVAQMGLL